MIEDMALGPDDEEPTQTEQLRYVRDGLIDLGDIVTDVRAECAENLDVSWADEKLVIDLARLLQKAQVLSLRVLERLG